jgi:hypothetical protein
MKIIFWCEQCQEDRSSIDTDAGTMYPSFQTVDWGFCGKCGNRITERK